MLGVLTQLTQHRFCPGISFDFNGNLMVTGGNDASRSSIYSTQQRAWISAPDMRTPRGYRTSVTLSDGRIFQIGGSWVVPEFRGNKHGEIWDGQQWTSLPGARVDPILTADKGGNFRNDNHAMVNMDLLLFQEASRLTCFAVVRLVQWFCYQCRPKPCYGLVLHSRPRQFRSSWYTQRR